MLPLPGWRYRRSPHRAAGFTPVMAPLLALLVAFQGAVTSLKAADPASAVDFRRDVLPILSNRCFRCHGPDEETREADLRLDEREQAVGVAGQNAAGSQAGAIVPGQPDASPLWHRITSDDPEARMPPPAAGDPLTDAERQTLRAWIAAGAEYARHWSFDPPRKQPAPRSRQGADWAQAALDRWVLASLEEIDWQPNAVADRATLLRRVTLDLTGLPPTIAEVEAFERDANPNAYRRVVDRLLASPAYGERWAKVWLDLARYADSAGYAQDPPRVIHRYRDWVIDAHNAGISFDEFTIQQLAGDLQPGATDEQLLATAFHRNTLTNSEGGTDDEEFRTAAVVDRVNTTMGVWMGLTIGCAQCHSHKYDPISQEDYYRVFAVFNNTADADRGDEEPLLTEYTAAERKQRAELEGQLAPLRQQREALAGQNGGAGSEEAIKTLDGQIGALQDSLNKLSGVRTPIFRELPADQRRETHVMVRGNFLAKAQRVEPGVLGQFSPLPEGASPDRLGLAQWLMDPRNPLTARVTVNRLWEQLFGVGLVETAEDFGLQGERPSHEGLLDHLALELLRGGWDTKRMLRQIVLSSTYCQSSIADEAQRTQDPQNRRLARGPSFRLPAEMLRDQALALGGLLSRKLHGPSVQPPRPALGLNSAFGGSTDWEPSQGEDRYRRGLYTNWRRTTPYPSFTTFDAPSREVCTIRRLRTNTPLQALVTLNDPAFVEAAQGLARVILREASPAGDAAKAVSAAGSSGETAWRLERAWRHCVARKPSAEELAQLRQLYDLAIEHYGERPEEARRLARDPLGDPPFAVDDRELASWTVVANVLLNLDEVLAKK